MTERPFYLVWMSKTNQFFPYLNQMTYIWNTPNQANKKLVVESVAAVRLLPITELVAAKQGLFLKPFLRWSVFFHHSYSNSNLDLEI